MASNLPLLIFPQYLDVTPPPGQGFPPSIPTVPDRQRQILRLDQQLGQLKNEFAKFSGHIHDSAFGIEPEMTVVLELASRIDRLKSAVNAAGLTWLGEWDIDLEPDEDFQVSGNRTTINGRLFVSMVNQQGMEGLLRLWNKWRNGEDFPHGQTVWRQVFKCLKHLRPWGVEETLNETGMFDYFENFDGEFTKFQIECFYHRTQLKRQEVETNIRQMVNKAGGQLISNFIDIPEIAFHAVKVKMPTIIVNELIRKQDEYNLFINPNVMFFRQSGQSITSISSAQGEEALFPQKTTEGIPVAAVLDGVPNLRHRALDNRIGFDDPFDLAEKYLPGERQHGTMIASLILHGDRSATEPQPLDRKLHHIAILQPNPVARNFGAKEEHFPEDCFCEDRVERAVRRMLEGDGTSPAQAPNVKIINLSLGDPTRPFIHTPSPWARLLDFLSWKYKVLFCISAGNYTGGYKFQIPYSEYKEKSSKEKTELLLRQLQNTLSERRLLAPAESINSLTIGALHHDQSGDDLYLGHRVDLLPDSHLLPSPISRLGHGFRLSIKPEIYFPGGRQYYIVKNFDCSEFEVASSSIKPGQKVAWDSELEGENSKEVFSRGTSNAAALATRAGIQIYEVLEQLNQSNDFRIPEENLAVLVKTLLVHGSMQSHDAKNSVGVLKNSDNSKIFKRVTARYLGYGEVNIERVLGCTEQRGTVLGFGQIAGDRLHQFRLPIPVEFGDKRTFRRMVVTLAWFTPINPNHRNLREAKLELQPGQPWRDTALKVGRIDGDHNQVKKGTVQHEVLEGNSLLGMFQESEEIALEIACKKDATVRLEEKIPYGLAVTLEAAEGSNIPVYEVIRQRLAEPVEVYAS